MPAKSRNQRIATAIAEYNPSKLYKRNKSLKKMTKEQLHDYAETSEKDLPKKVKSRKKK